MTKRSWGAETFERLYAADADPWRFESSCYERDKYAASLAALGRRRFCTALEIGCSIGVFTRQLARRCDHVRAVDIAQSAVEAARRRCRGLPQVRVEQRALPAQWPGGAYDLIVLSEVLYFLRAEDLARLARRVRHCLRPGGVALLVNWTGPTDTPRTGEQASTQFLQVAQLRPVRRARRATYRLDVLRAPTQRR